jgi:hypothetical protein
VDEVYRGYRIAIRMTDRWTARITHVRGPVVPLSAVATAGEGEGQCLIRARALVDRYVEFLALNDIDGKPN